MTTLITCTVTFFLGMLIADIHIRMRRRRNKRIEVDQEQMRRKYGIHR
jgi:hypothetical protein